MKYIIKIVILFIGLSTLNIACTKQGPAEIPSYLVVDTVYVETEPGQGTESARFPFVWVYVDNNLLGGFPVGKRIPVLKKGEVKIEMYPGIYTNGQVVRTDVYFMMAPYEATVNLHKDEITHLSPVFKYDEGVEFRLVEDFETGNVFKRDLDANPATFLMRTEEDVYEGTFSGRLLVTSEDTVNAVAMSNPISDTIQNRLTFVELDYKCNTDLLLGLIGLDETGEQFNFAKISLKPSDKYHKIYIDITEDIARFQAQSIVLYFVVVYNDRYEQEKQQVLIDNVKVLIHY